MPMSSSSSPASTVSVRTVVALALACLMTLVTAASAVADPVTYPDPAGSDRTITLDAATYAPGATVAVSGTGFLGTDGQGGVVVVVKPDDDGFAAAGFGGTDATAAVSGHPAFSSEADGSFAGWVTLPSDLATTGPGTGAYAGQHFLRFLAGSLGNPGPSLSLQAWFGVAAPAPPPAAVSATLADMAVAAGGTLSFSFTGFVQSAGGGQHVGLKLDDGAIVGCVPANADGSGSGAVAVPATLAPGVHTLRLLGGTACVSIGDGGSLSEGPAHNALVSFTVTAPAAQPQPQPAPQPPVASPAPTKPATPATPVPYATLATGSKPLTARATGVSLKLTGHGARGTVHVTVTTARKVRLRSGRGRAAIVTVARARSVTLAAGATRTVRLTLTRDGRLLLARVAHVQVRVRLAGGKTVVETLALRPAPTAKAKAKR